MLDDWESSSRLPILSWDGWIIGLFTTNRDDKSCEPATIDTLSSSVKEHKGDLLSSAIIERISAPIYRIECDSITEFYSGLIQPTLSFIILLESKSLLSVRLN